MDLIIPPYESIVDVHEIVLQSSGGRPGIHVESDIHRAAERPKTYTTFVEDFDLDTICALLIDSISRYHGFNDGNKRTALLTATFTYRVNGVHFKATATMNREFDALVMWVVKKKPEITQIEERLKRLRAKHQVASEPTLQSMLLAFVRMRITKERQRSKNKRPRRD